MTQNPGKMESPSPGPDGQPHEEQPKWRRDFPLDVLQDNYVARRDFVKFMVLTSGAFVVGQAWIGLHSFWRRAKGLPARQQIASLAALPVGGVLEFYYPTSKNPCLLVRPDQDTLLAYSQVCTHLACAVQPRMEQGKFECPCHNGWFDMATGRVLAGPPTRPLPRITLVIENGTIYATGVELST